MKSPRILVVEDDGVIALDIERRLCSLGFEVVGVVGTGEEALQRIEQEPPDLVLLDINLQGQMDGIEVARRIREEHELPVVFLTAYSDTVTLSRAKQVLPYGYLLKPFETRELQVVVETSLARARIERELAHITRLHATISEINQTIVRVEDPQALLEAVCRILVERGGFLNTWIAWHEATTGRMGLRAFAGAARDLVERRACHADEEQNGACCPCSRAFREGRPIVIRDVSTAPEFQDCAAELQAAGIRGVAVLPIPGKEHRRGVLVVGDGRRCPFEPREVDLLVDAAEEVGFALDRMEGELRRREAEAALQQTLRDLERTQAVGHAGSWISEPSRGTLIWSRETCRIFGLDPAEFDGRIETFYRLVHPEDREQVRQAAQRCWEGGETYVSEHRIVRPDGTICWVQERGELERDAEGRPKRLLGFVLDITERIEGETLRRLHSVALEAAADPVIITDADGIIEPAKRR